METSKKRLSGGRLIFLNLGYLAIGIIIFLAINPFSWWEVNEPEDIAREFLEAVENGNWDKAKKYATDDTDSALEMMESLAEPNYRAVTILQTVQDNHKIYVSYTLDYASETLFLTLVKERGDWRAETTKEELNNRGDEEDDTDWGSELEDIMEEELDSPVEETDWDTEPEEATEEVEWEETIEDSDY